jgi:hypothetical protein
MDEIRERSGDDEMPNLAICGNGVWNSFMQLMQGSRRFNGETQKFNMWGTAIVFPGMPPIVKTNQCQPTWMWVLQTKDIKIYQNDEGKWQDNGAGGVLIPISGQVGFRAAWYQMMQLIVRNPNRHGVIKDLAYVGAAA